MSKEKELKVIRQAMLNELEAYDFYTLAAGQASNDDARAAFHEMAAEEQKHIDWLRKLYKLIVGETVEDFDAAFEEPPSPSLHTVDVIGRESGTLPVSVFGIGVNLEKAAIDFYTAAAEQTEYEEAKKLYQLIIRWEQQHLDQFQAKYDQLQEEWWQEQGFSPS